MFPCWRNALPQMTGPTACHSTPHLCRSCGHLTHPMQTATPPARGRPRQLMVQGGLCTRLLRPKLGRACLPCHCPAAPHCAPAHGPCDFLSCLHTTSPSRNAAAGLRSTSPIGPTRHASGRGLRGPLWGLAAACTPGPWPPARAAPGCALTGPGLGACVRQAPRHLGSAPRLPRLLAPLVLLLPPIWAGPHPGPQDPCPALPNTEARWPPDLCTRQVRTRQGPDVCCFVKPQAHLPP